MRSDIVPGGVFPDYELPDHTNTKRRLSDLQGEDPLILTLARGHFCPKPDWDLSTPGLRQGWDAGDRSRFHGWNRWSPQRFAAELKRVAG
jgi:hypothetical protein